MLLKGFFRTQSSNPDWPTEEWTLIDQVTTPGAYSKTLDFGRYKIELSGGGGSGGAAAGPHGANSRNYANNGASGKLFVGIIEVGVGDTRTISGIVASGGGEAWARGGDGEPYEFHAGTAGSGATSGSVGTGERHGGGYPGNAAVGGSGGGSTSAVGVGIAAGGAGGNAKADTDIGSHHQSDGYGGAGASGSNQGNGAAGGIGRYVKDGRATSGAGANGWVKIYRSTTYPEPI